MKERQNIISPQTTLLVALFGALTIAAIIAYIIGPLPANSTMKQVTDFAVRWWGISLPLGIFCLIYRKQYYKQFRKEDIEEARKNLLKNLLKNVDAIATAYAPNFYCPLPADFDVLALMKTDTSDLEKFHIAQAYILKAAETLILLFVLPVALFIVGGIAGVLVWLLLIVVFVVTAFAINTYCVKKAKRGEYWKFPVIGNFAEKIKDKYNIVSLFAIAPLLIFFLWLGVLVIIVNINGSMT